MSLPSEIVTLASALHSGGAADAHVIAEAEAQLGFQLPDEYREFVRFNDGAEGFVGDTYVSFWHVSEVAELNAFARVERFAPGLTAFGTDGGTEFFGFDRRGGGFAVVEMPVVGIEWGYARPHGDSFVEFLRDAGGDALRSGRKVLGFGVRRPRPQKVNPDLFGKNVWQIQPVILGGHPTDPKNRTILPLRKMLEAANFWNDQLVSIQEPQPLTMDLGALRKDQAEET